MRWFWLIAAGLLLLLQARMWVGESSLAQLHATEKTIAEQQQINNALKAKNDEIAAEVISLQSDTELLEEKARRDMGLIKPGETFYYLPKQQP